MSETDFVRFAIGFFVGYAVAAAIGIYTVTRWYEPRRPSHD